MSTVIYTHSACLAHDTGMHHPESPDRLRAVLAALETPPLDRLERIEAPRASLDQIGRVHAKGYAARVLDHIPESGHFSMDADTIVSPGSGEAALRAAGALCAAVDAVVGGDATRAFCAVRPPGHHAEPDQAMGFCLFNNVAIGAAHARAEHGLDRVAIVDFDVHHGNGTQAMFEREAAVLFASSQQMPLYPGSGSADEIGVGNIVNMPLPPGTAGEGFRCAWRENGLARLREHRPELIFISAGFDGHKDDPLANLALVENDYDWLTREVTAIAEETGGGRVISTLEGGYNLAALGRSVAAHVAALADDSVSHGGQAGILRRGH